MYWSVRGRDEAEISALSFMEFKVPYFCFFPFRNRYSRFPFSDPQTLITPLAHYWMVGWADLSGRKQKGFLEEERRRQQADATLASCSPRPEILPDSQKTSVPQENDFDLTGYNAPVTPTSGQTHNSSFRFLAHGPEHPRSPLCPCVSSFPSQRRRFVIVRRTQKGEASVELSAY